MFLQDILAKKSPEVVTVQTGSLVINAVRQMVEHKIGAVIIVDGENLIGIFTERDHLKASATGTPDPGSSIIDDYMTRDIVIGLSSDTVEAAMAMMTEKRVRHLPIMDGSRLTGIVSIGDVVKAVAEKQESELRYLKDYVSGKVS